MNETQESGQGPAVAVIGMAGRFPGARDLEEFWELLRDSREAIIRFQPSQLKEDSLLTSQPEYVPAKAILQDIEFFDAAFFGFHPREAEVLNPQHRLFLECCWEALENGGYAPDRNDLPVGVFAGASSNNYAESVISRTPMSASLDGFQSAILNDRDHLPTGVSYRLNLRGPSVNVQTACSTSLVAIHMACQSLLAWECDMALAGGVSVRLPQEQGYLYQPGGIESPDGHCRPFDECAEGTVGGNGVGVVLLKRLDDALRDGDTVLAVVRGSAINNDGHLKAGYTAPSIIGQAEVIQLAQGVAGVGPGSITYIEAHGTGTPVGDPIEITALTQAFRTAAAAGKFCALGAVKSNIGHLDVAAGVAGFIKTVLALQRRQIPSTLHFRKPNPRMDLDSTPFYVVDRLTDWKSEGPRRAGVSSFGIGGTNAHVVLEEAPARLADPSLRKAHLLVVSAKSKTALRSSLGRLTAHLRRNSGSSEIADTAHTLQIGRTAFPHRSCVVCCDTQQAIQELEKALAHEDFRLANNAPPSVAFLFPGQGSQYAGMVRQLYHAEPLFRKYFDCCSSVLKPELGADLKDLLFDEAKASQLQETWLTQPALFAVEYSLARLWMDYGVQPQAMLGHSLGEYVAACLAGVLPLEKALRVVAFRGRLMASLPRGVMTLVLSGAAELQNLLENGLSVAAVNGEALSVVAGPFGAMDRFEQRAVQAGLTVRRLRTSHAFHSGMMEPMMEQFGEFLSKLEMGVPTLNFISNVTGDWIKAKDATDPQYWTQHLRSTVQFHAGMSSLLKSAHKVVLEVGPGTSLSKLANQHPERTAEHLVLSSLPSEQSSAEFDNILKTAGALWCAGIELNWKSFYSGERRWRVPLPTYPFERKRYWIESAIGNRAGECAAANQGGSLANGGPPFTSVPPGPAPQASRAGRSDAHSIISAQLNVISQQLRVLKANK